MKERTQYIARCQKTGQYFMIDTRMEGNTPSVINFTDLTDDQFQKLGARSAWPSLSVSSTLRACRWCGSRKVGECSCQRQKWQCPMKGVYSYQCLFCDQLKPVSGGRAGDIKDLKIAVTSPCFDDIGPLLISMGLKTLSFAECQFDCDMLFINCGTKDQIDAGRLASFVRNGGCVYISDLAISVLSAAFPGAVSYNNNSRVVRIPASIEDPELRKIIGSSIQVNFDLGGWARIEKHRGDCLIRGAALDIPNPLMIFFHEGDGQVFYTSFHNHKQASKEEQTVLKVMLLRQISSTVNKPIMDVINDLGLNIGV